MAVRRKEMCYSCRMKCRGTVQGLPDEPADGTVGWLKGKVGFGEPDLLGKCPFARYMLGCV